MKNMEKIISENTILKVYLADSDISATDLVHLKEYLDEYVRFVVDEDAKMIYFDYVLFLCNLEIINNTKEEIDYGYVGFSCKGFGSICS